MTERVYLFKGFERFWHWSQAALIIFLMVTGFEIHGTYTLFGFEKAVGYHTIAAWSLVGLWVFAIFWHVTTGEWRQYIPTTEKVMAIAQLLLCRASSRTSRIRSSRRHCRSTTRCSA